MKMLFNIYLATALASFGVTWICDRAYVNRMKREGYKFVNKKKSISEKIVDNLETVLFFAIPGL